MSGKPSQDNAKAKAAYEKAQAAGKPLTVLELAAKCGVAPSTIYRSKWFIRPAKP